MRCKSMLIFAQSNGKRVKIRRQINVEKKVESTFLCHHNRTNNSIAIQNISTQHYKPTQGYPIKNIERPTGRK